MCTFSSNQIYFLPIMLEFFFHHSCHNHNIPSKWHWIHAERTKIFANSTNENLCQFNLLLWRSSYFVYRECSLIFVKFTYIYLKFSVITRTFFVNLLCLRYFYAFPTLEIFRLNDFVESSFLNGLFEILTFTVLNSEFFVESTLSATSALKFSFKFQVLKTEKFLFILLSAFPGPKQSRKCSVSRNL